MMGTHQARVIGVAIDRPPREVYDFVVIPENLPAWASGLGTSGRRVGDEWLAQTEQGPVRVRFVERNDFGVLDHHVTLPGGQVVYNPMRVVANGGGSEVTFTLFRPPGVADDAFEADAAWIARDLQGLKRLLEG
jgi:hypothetical protein